MVRIALARGGFELPKYLKIKSVKTIGRLYLVIQSEKRRWYGKNNALARAVTFCQAKRLTP